MAAVFVVPVVVTVVRAVVVALALACTSTSPFCWILGVVAVSCAGVCSMGLGTYKRVEPFGERFGTF